MYIQLSMDLNKLQNNERQVRHLFLLGCHRALLNDLSEPAKLMSDFKCKLKSSVPKPDKSTFDEFLISLYIHNYIRASNRVKFSSR